ncbi:MAG: hypothetical protein AB4290_13420 [Spirulina sp.]
MITCNWAILCQQSIVNAETNNISLMEILDEYYIPKPPESERIIFYDFDYEVVVELQRDRNGTEENIVFRLEIFSPSGETLLKGKRSVFFNKNTLKVVSRLRLQGLPILKEGFYKFTIQLPKQHEEETVWETVKEVALEINYLDDEDEEVQEEETDRESE